MCSAVIPFCRYTCTQNIYQHYHVLVVRIGTVLDEQLYDCLVTSGGRHVKSCMGIEECEIRTLLPVDSVVLVLASITIALSIIISSFTTAIEPEYKAF